MLEPEPVEDDTPLPSKPSIREGCDDVPRPCAYASCRYHLLLVVLPSGHIQTPHGHDDPTLLPERGSCALDVAEDRTTTGTTLDEVGRLLGITRERTRQIVDTALLKSRFQAARLEARASRTRR